MSIAGGHFRAVENAVKVKGTALQIFTRNQRQWNAPPLTDDEVRAFRTAFDESGLRFLCSHASYLLNLASGEPESWKRSIAALRAELEWSEALGCHCVVVHPGSHLGDGVDLGIRRVADAMKMLLKETSGFSVGIALENTAGQGNMLGGNVEELAEIAKFADFPGRLGVCLDTAHAFGAGVDLRTPQAVREWAEGVKAGVGVDRVWGLHLNDTICKCGSKRDQHTHIGKGEIGKAGFVNVLREPLFLGIPGIVETPKDKKDELKFDRINIRRLRSME
jgi:deoxyribonuclease-4